MSDKAEGGSNLGRPTNPAAGKLDGDPSLLRDDTTDCSWRLFQHGVEVDGFHVVGGSETIVGQRL